jgi:hypothetical protein
LKMPTDEELAQVWRDMQQWLKTRLIDRKSASSGTEPRIP